MKNKKVLIFFPEGNLPYSPTTLSLFEYLKSKRDVKIFCQPFINEEIFKLTDAIFIKPFNNKDIFYKKVATRLRSLFPKYFSHEFTLQEYSIYRQFIKLQKNERFELIIAVDLFALRVCQLCNINNLHFLSLELSDIKFLNKIKTNNIKTVIIQREDRLKYLFGDHFKRDVFYIQNAPKFRDFTPLYKKKKQIIFSGFASKGFGIYICLNFIKANPDYTLTINGIIENSVMENIIIHYYNFVVNNNIIIETQYIPDKQMNEYLSQFSMGFCFYDFRYDYINNFNYQTAPSGKLFKYLAAGLPVIGSDIPGLDVIKDFNCGVLIGDYSTESILKGIRYIEDNYDELVSNCYKVAKKFDFEKAVFKYLDYLD